MAEKFDPIENRGLAALLDSERKKVCGIMGDTDPEDIECYIDHSACPYNFLEFANAGGSECALKFVSRAMKGWEDPAEKDVRKWEQEADADKPEAKA